MIITVSDFVKATGFKRDTVYSWIYRDRMPVGLKLAGIGKTKILEVSKEYKHWKKLQKVAA